MKATIGCLILVFVVCASAEPLLEGRVRLDSGEPVADAQVRLFDMSDLRQGAIARAQTDGTGYFALPLAALAGRALPERFALGPNYPNPFNPSTIIPYQLAALSEVRLEVFNLLGQHIATLVDGERPAGFHTATWHATDGAGRAIAAGVYIYRMMVGVERQTGRMVLLDGQVGVSAVGVSSVMLGASSVGGSNGAESEVYGLIVSGAGLAPYVDSSFRVEAGMAPVELVVSSGYSGGKLTDDDCAFSDLFDALNDGEEEEEARPSGKAQAILEAPSPPTNLRFDAPTDSSCTVRWDASDGATDYDVNYKPAVGGQWTNEPHRGTRLSNTINDLASGTEYRWAVRAENGDGSSVWVFGPNFTTLEEDTSDPSLPNGILIPDPALRTFIEQALGKNPGEAITQADMNNLTVLSMKNLGIADLRGLETAKNLTWVNIDSNRVSDLAPLSALTNLEFLAFGDNRVSDLTPLSTLTNLEHLYFLNNQVSDLTPLSTLTNLEYLYFLNNQVSDLTPLGTLTNLTLLYVANNWVSDLTPLGTLTNLKWLYVANNRVSDLIPLSTLADLESLDFSENRVSDLTLLKNLSNLREIYFSWNSVSDLSPLVALPHLELLDALSNPLSKASIDKHIPALQRRGVDVSFTPFYTLTFTETESSFNIDLVFLDSFTEEEQEVWHDAAKRWEAAIQTELPDYSFSDAWSGTCGDHSMNIPAGERIEGLRIYVVKFGETRFNQGVGGFGGPVALGSNSLPFIGCIGIKTRSTFSLQRLRYTALHEMAHVLGIGTIWFNKGMLRELNGDTHFPGPKAIAAFDQAGGTDYQGAKVPTERDGTHWRTSALSGELMSTFALDPVISAITLQALSDLGYLVDLSAANPYVLSSPAAAKPVADAELEFFCSLEGLPAPVYLDD